MIVEPEVHESLLCTRQAKALYFRIGVEGVGGGVNVNGRQSKEMMPLFRAAVAASVRSLTFNFSRTWLT